MPDPLQALLVDAAGPRGYAEDARIEESGDGQFEA
jgi:hypothetical protein